MAKNYDISRAMKEAGVKPEIRIDETTVLKVNAEVVHMIRVEETLRNEDLSDTQQQLKIIKILLGEKQYKKINPDRMQIEQLKELVISLMAAMYGEDIDTVKSRFQD